jgi:translocator protein
LAALGVEAKGRQIMGAALVRHMRPRSATIVTLIAFVALVGAAALIGAQFTPGAWYESLARPSWTPPGWLFGPVWTVLYAAIAVSGWLAWREAPGLRSSPLIAWAVQLILNTSWSWVFFGLHRPALALGVILLLLLAIIAFAVTVKSRLAAGLFLAYALWVSFATALNFEIVRLNW